MTHASAHLHLPDAPEAVEREVRLVARASARHRLAHAYGHCSARLDEQHFLVCAARPMGLVGQGEAGTVVAVHEPLPAGVLGEVRIHQQIYAARSDVRGILRSMPPALMALSTARRVPKPRHGMGTYFGAGPALWDSPQLVRDEAAAHGVAAALGTGRAVVMRGNGTVMAADSLRLALVLTWYLEDAARLELEVRKAGLDRESVQLTRDECSRRATTAGGIVERMWEYLTENDPEK